jgi:GT2 family glycosyltransferase
MRLGSTPGGLWAAFDARWYLRRYPDIGPAATADDPGQLVEFYLTVGQQAGHSPNPYFDEAWYLQRHPDVAAAIRDGTVQSGFDEYCRCGTIGRSPHWLYSDHTYQTTYADLTPEALEAGGFVNHYDHYLREGSREGRIAHPLFDPAFYRAQLDPDEAAEADQDGAFRHYLRRLADGKPELRTSVYFDPDGYRLRYPAIAEQIGPVWLGALHHYLANATPTAFDPLLDFSEAAYLERYPDVAAAVATGQPRNGYQHFLAHGVFELRAPTDAIDLRRYVAGHKTVQQDLDTGRTRDAFVHFLTIGRAQGLAEVGDKEQQSKLLFRTRADNLVPLAARHPLDFTLSGPPALAAVMVLHNEFPLSLMALGSLRQNHPGAIELLLVDSGSDDETRNIVRYVHGAKLLSFDSNIGFVRACNAALARVTAPAVLFLNNDVELAPGAVANALRRLGADPRIGAVGGKIIRSHGRLQEAGSLVWRDGVTHGYLRDASPLAPEANFVRDVDYCSGAFLLVRADLLARLEGFVEDYAPAYYEDADLCARIWQAGFRVVYDPSVVVHHLEYGSAVNFRAVEVQSARSRQVFVRRNASFLRSRYIADPRVEVFARSARTEQRRILFIEDQVPLRLLGSGFVRSNDLIGVMASLGFHVTVFPIYGGRFDVGAVYADLPDTVEVMHDRSLDDLPAFLDSRDGYYDSVWVVRTHNLDRVLPALERYCLGKGRPPRIVLDAEAIAAERDAVRAAVRGAAAGDLDAAVLREFRSAALCQRIVATSAAEAATLRRLGFTDVAVIGHIRAVRLTPRPFAERSGMLFVGAIHEQDSPNYDSLCWFVDEVLPLVEDALGWETRLTIAGYTTEAVDLERFRGHSRVTLRGTVADTEPLYDSHRVFVAPTRFAAGTPYKVHEAASFGLPVVATELLRRQIGWQNGRELLAAEASDPALFAQHIVSVYRDPALWERLRNQAAERLRAENGRESYEQALRDMLG